MADAQQPVWILRADGELVAQEPQRPSLVPEVSADDVIEVVEGHALPTPPPRARAVSVTGVGEKTPQAPRRPVSAIGRVRPIKERDRRSSPEVEVADDSRVVRARELYTQAMTQLERGQRTQAMSSLRLASSYAPGDLRYAKALEALERGDPITT